MRCNPLFRRPGSAQAAAERPASGAAQAPTPREADAGELIERGSPWPTRRLRWMLSSLPGRHTASR